MMKVLVIGGGGREHALVWKIAQSPKVKTLYCAPGNAGISDLATCVPIAADDIESLVQFAKKERIDLTVTGPEDPLAQGIVNRFCEEGLKIFGATKQAAELESSKSFAKTIMDKYAIPTARGKTFTSLKKAEQYIRTTGVPVVVKADGLAAGKGVIVCDTMKKAMDALNLIMKDRAFGNAGSKVIVEECLFGEEASFLAFTDGSTVLPLPSSQDHKAVLDNDQGPNTGGMGAYSPAPVVDRYMYRKIMNEIMVPTIQAMAAEGRPYQGVLYAGLMISKDRIHVLEFNCRFGDPEAQPLLMRIKNDIVPILEATVTGNLHRCRLEIDDRPSVCVVMAAGGYPESYKKGMTISGLSNVKRMKDIVVFHAGTSRADDGIATSGGRVLGVTALGNSIGKAIDRAYAAVSKISWHQVHYRKDIGKKALIRIQQTPRVGIVMGSDSDLDVMMNAVGVLKQFDIYFDMTVASAHRSPQKAAEYAAAARSRGIQVIIAGAGHAAHLAGVLAAHTPLPIIGVPIDSSSLNGFDALLSTVQMPPGVPVATMAVGKSGAKNAGIFAVQILAASNPELADQLEMFKRKMALEVEQKAGAIHKF
jgi:phosphoribosylamine---glycine ligase